MITFLRVDHRLLHGQVIYSWLKSIDCNVILIANDNVAQDEVRQQLLKLSAPADKQLLMRTIEQSADILRNPKNQPAKFFIITENIRDAWQLTGQISAIEKINIGSVKISANAEKINNAVFLNEQDKTILRQFLRRNIALDVRQTADETAINISEFL